MIEPSQMKPLNLGRNGIFSCRLKKGKFKQATETKARSTLIKVLLFHFNLNRPKNIRGGRCLSPRAPYSHQRSFFSLFHHQNFDKSKKDALCQQGLLRGFCHVTSCAYAHIEPKGTLDHFIDLGKKSLRLMSLSEISLA